MDTQPVFVPRPFPPSPLVGIPFEYVIDQLRTLAPHFWNAPETADCTIVVPLDESSDMPSVYPPPLPQDPLGRRRTEPCIQVRQISFKLHSDYLCTHSRFLRALFSGARPLDLISSTSHNSSPISSSPSGSDHRIPHLLSSSPSHPILFLPVPDPSSIHLLLHWMYFGSFDQIDKFLGDFVVEWQGLARNVEYLDLNNEIRTYLMDWWHQNLRPTSLSIDDTDDSGIDSDDEDEPLDSEDEEDHDILEYGSPAAQDPNIKPEWRGRSRTVRVLTACPQNMQSA